VYIIKGPLVKEKVFCPNPVVVYGIPAYADSENFPQVEGTPAHQQWWEEQLHYCLHGYKTGGIWIPGRLYKFLNFDKIETIKGGSQYPEYFDYQLEYAYLIERAKHENKNIIVPKARRKAVSTMTVGMIIDYGYRFIDGYKGGVGGGKKEFTDDFMDKWSVLDSLMVAEFKTKKLADTSDEIVAGWKEESVGGGMQRAGSKNTIYAKTVHSTPGIFKGKFMHDVIWEEAGENENLIEAIAATEPCLMWGGKQIGTNFVYGTSGDMAKGSKDFKEMWYNHEDYNCMRHFIPATKFYPPCYSGSTDEVGVIDEDIPNLQHLEPHQRVGMDDEIQADKLIKLKKEKYLKSNDLTKYYDFCKENPVTIEEVFRKYATNNFPIDKLNEQGHKILSGPKRYSKFHLSYKLNERGVAFSPPQILATPAKDSDEEAECVMILDDGGHPIKGYRFLYTGGIDSYDQDQSKTSKSLGAMVVILRRHQIPDVQSYLPVCLVRNRPRYKEKFYEMCLMVSIYYGLHQSTQYDVRTPMVAKYYEDHGCGEGAYLAPRPRKFESPNSKQVATTGFALTQYSRPQMVSLLQTFFDHNAGKVWFPQVIDEALNYDEYEIGSDNDSVDALGIALIQDADMENQAFDEEAVLASNPFNYGEWEQDSSGNLVDVSSPTTEKPLGVDEDWFSRQARIQLSQGDNADFGEDNQYPDAPKEGEEEDIFDL
jgi:hypothetical protein